ncbi:unnamed protein product [Amoebophrya sp. A120]|nr:unnamed protein product [Amoebophrya sp. A120]|eukprot:GSA120T00022318001.1
MNVEKAKAYPPCEAAPRRPAHCMMQTVIFSRLSRAVCNYKLFCKRCCLASWFVELAVYFLLFATTTSLSLFSSDGAKREISTASALRIRGVAVKEDEAEPSRLCRSSAQPARRACVRFVTKRPAPPRWHLTAMRTSPAASGSSTSTSRAASASGKSKLLYGDRLPVAYEESERRYGHDSSVGPALHAPAVITTSMTGGCTSTSAGAFAEASDERDDHRPGTSTPAAPLDATADGGPGPIPAEVFRRYLWTDMLLEKGKLLPATRSSAQRPRKELPPAGKDEMQEDSTAAVKIPLKFHYNDGRESQEGGFLASVSTLRTERQEELHEGGKEHHCVPAGHTQEPSSTSASTTAVRPRSKNLHDARAARTTVVAATAKPIKPIYTETVVMQQKLPKLPEPLDQLDDEKPFSFANLQKRNSSTSLLPPIIPPRSTTLGADDLTVGITQSDFQGSALPNFRNGCNFDGTTLHKVYVYNNLTANLNDCEFVPFQSVFLAKDFDRLADDEKCEELCNRGKNVDAKGTGALNLNLKQEDPRFVGDERDSQTVGPRTSSGEDRLSKSQGCAGALLQSAGINKTDVEMSSLFFPEHEATPYSFFNATTLFAATAGEDEELPPDFCTTWTVPTSVQSLPASPTTGAAGATRHRAAHHLQTLSPWTAASCLAGVLLLSSASPPIIHRNLETSHVISLAAGGGSSSSSPTRTPLKTNARLGSADASAGATGTRATCSSCSGPPGHDGLFCRRSTMVKNHVFCCSKGEKSSSTSSRRCRSSPGLLERRKAETREEEGVSCTQTQTPTAALLPLASGTTAPCDDEEDIVVDENSPPPEDGVEHQDESSSWPVSAAIGDFFSDFATSIADTLFGNHERRLEEAKREGEFVKGGHLDSSEIALFLHTIASSAAYQKRISKFSSKVDGCYSSGRTVEASNKSNKAKAVQQEDADRRYDEQLQEELYAFTEYLAKKPIFGTRQVNPDARKDSWARRDTVKDKRTMTNKPGAAGRTSAGLFVEKNAGTKSRSSSDDDEDKIADEASILYRAMYKLERRLWVTNVGRAMKEIAKYRRNSKWILGRDEGVDLHLHEDLHESQGTSPHIIDRDRPSNPTVLDDYEFALQQIGTREFREGNALTQYVYKQEPGRWQAGYLRCKYVSHSLRRSSGTSGGSLSGARRAWMFYFPESIAEFLKDELEGKITFASSKEEVDFSQQEPERVGVGVGKQSQSSSVGVAPPPAPEQQQGRTFSAHQQAASVPRNYLKKAVEDAEDRNQDEEEEEELQLRQTSSTSWGDESTATGGTGVSSSSASPGTSTATDESAVQLIIPVSGSTPAGGTPPHDRTSRGDPDLHSAISREPRVVPPASGTPPRPPRHVKINHIRVNTNALVADHSPDHAGEDEHFYLNPFVTAPPSSPAAGSSAAQGKIFYGSRSSGSNNRGGAESAEAEADHASSSEEFYLHATSGTSTAGVSSSVHPQLPVCTSSAAQDEDRRRNLLQFSRVPSMRENVFSVANLDGYLRDGVVGSHAAVYCNEPLP